MSFKKFLSEIKSIRDYEQNSIGNLLLNDINEYLNKINSTAGEKNGFSFKLFENGTDVFESLEGVGGYSGVMIRSPHYIGLMLDNENMKTEFLGAYYFQSIVKKLYELDLGSCWINIRNVSESTKHKLLNSEDKEINYLLSFGRTDVKGAKQKTSTIHVQSGESYKTNPYGAKIVESLDTETCRLGLEEIVFLHKWGEEITYEELESRGLADLFQYVRNAPSYKNKQPCRFILKDGETCLAIKNPNNKENITDAGIMLFTVEGMAKDTGIPVKWYYKEKYEQDADKEKAEYVILAKIEL